METDRYTNGNITIRRVQPGDAPALYDFYDALSPGSKRTFAPFGQNPTLDKYEEVVAANASPAGDKFDLVAVQGDRIVGWSFVWDLNKKEPFFGLGVADEIHGRGWGSRLMDSVLATMRQSGLKKLYLTVVTDNNKAWGLYGRRGFVRMGEFAGSDGLPYYRMILDLDSTTSS
jgi:ribosomal protein S18 acetylase RimI-like enzyme